MGVDCAVCGQTFIIYGIQFQQEEWDIKLGILPVFISCPIKVLPKNHGSFFIFPAQHNTRMQHLICNILSHALWALAFLTCTRGNGSDERTMSAWFAASLMQHPQSRLQAAIARICCIPDDLLIKKTKKNKKTAIKIGRNQRGKISRAPPCCYVTHWRGAPSQVCFFWMEKRIESSIPQLL